ncbi:MAG: hypothetical protein ACI8W9_002066 [Psychromonas sp.]
MASYCSIKRLAIIIFSCAILDHLLMQIGIRIYYYHFY